MLTWLRELAETVLTFDRSALEPGYALRCAIGVAIPLILAAIAGNPAMGVPAAIGAFITGFTSLQGIYRTRIAAVLLAAIGMSITSFIGALAAHSTPGLVAATAIAGFAVGTIGQIGPIASTVALNSFVAFVIFSSQPLSPPVAAQDSALVLSGGLIQAILVLIAWPIARRGTERAALADVYRNLATYARAIATGEPAFPPMTPLATARQVLADPHPFARSAELARLGRLLEDAEIIRRRLGALAARIQNDGTHSALSNLAEAIAAQLGAVTDVLIGKRETGSGITLPTPDEAKRAGVADISAHVRDALEAGTMLATGRLPSFDLLSKPRPGPYVENHIRWFSRDSFRYALVLGIAMFLGRHFQADRGYWIPLTAAIVLRPDFRTTFVRGFARIGGTLVGAVVATFVAALLHGYPALQMAGVIVTAGAAYLTFNPNYALYTVAITSFVVITLSMRGLPGTTTVAMRLLSTLAGGGLAMVGYLLAPSWESRRTRALLADMLEAQRRLADAIFDAYEAPSDATRRRAIDRERAELWKARTAVESSIDRTRHEPTRPHTIGAARALRILAASQRLGFANLALETALETQHPAAVAEAQAMRPALDAELAELAAALAQSRSARLDQRLTDIASKLEDDIDAASDPTRRRDLERLLAYPEAAARIARLVGAKKAHA